MKQTLLSTKFPSFAFWKSSILTTKSSEMILIFRSIGHCLYPFSTCRSLPRRSLVMKGKHSFRLLMKIIRNRKSAKAKLKSFHNLLSLMLHILEFGSRPFVFSFSWVVGKLFSIYTHFFFFLSRSIEVFDVFLGKLKRKQLQHR